MLAQIRCPTLVICGEHDFICGPPDARVIVGGVMGAELAVFENCGHVPGIETPESYRAAIFDGLDRTG